MLKRLTSHSLLLIILGFCLSFSIGCGVYKEEKIEARVFIDSYFKYIKKQNYNYLLSFYSDDAFGEVSPSKALGGMKKALRSFGYLESSILKDNSVYIYENKFGGLTAKLTYNVVYRDMKTRETFAISKIKTKRKWIITSHTINRKK